MTQLAHRVPITLLADLLDPAGPHSREIYRVEAVADDIRQEMAATAAAEGAAAAGTDVAEQAHQSTSDFTTHEAAC